MTLLETLNFEEVASAELKQALASIQSQVLVSKWSIQTRVSPDETVLVLEVSRRRSTEVRHKSA